jgi:hypothetical protein
MAFKMHEAEHIRPSRKAMHTWQQEHYLHRLQHWGFRKAEADSQELHTAGQVRSCRGWEADHSLCFWGALQRHKLSSYCRRDRSDFSKHPTARMHPRIISKPITPRAAASLIARIPCINSATPSSARGGTCLCGCSVTSQAW